MVHTIPGDTLVVAVILLAVFAAAAIGLVSLSERVNQDPPDASDDLPDTREPLYLRPEGDT